MSKRETPLTRRYWDQLGGKLVEEFPLIRRGELHAQRLIDGLIILNEEKSLSTAKNVSIEGCDVVLIQTKAARLGMNLLGQAFFSRELLARHGPRSIRSVVICIKDDSLMRDLADNFNIEVVVYK